MGKGHAKKKNMAVFIDGENVAADKAEKIFSVIEQKGVLDYAKVYGIQKDHSTKKWSDVAKNQDNVKDIRLCGGPAHDKVDNKIKRDARAAVQNASNIDIFVIVSSDHGYADVISELKHKGKRVLVVGEEKAPERLRKAGSEFVMI